MSGKQLQNVNGCASCGALIAALLVLGLLIAILQWAAAHWLMVVAITIGGLVVCAAVGQSKRRNDPPTLRGSLGVLVIEDARSMAERRLLIGREFSRLASQTIACCPLSDQRPRWSRKLAGLEREAVLLSASAVDPAGLPAQMSPNEPLSTPLLLAAAALLCSFLAEQRTATAATPAPQPEQLRVLRRDRMRLIQTHEEITRRLEER